MSGAQVWNGTAETLNAKPITMKRMPTTTMADGASPPSSAAPISVRTVEPVTPKISDIP